MSIHTYHLSLFDIHKTPNHKPIYPVEVEPLQRKLKKVIVDLLSIKKHGKPLSITHSYFELYHFVMNPISPNSLSDATALLTDDEKEDVLIDVNNMYVFLKERLPINHRVLLTGVDVKEPSLSESLHFLRACQCALYPNDFLDCVSKSMFGDVEVVAFSRCYPDIYGMLTRELLSQLTNKEGEYLPAYIQRSIRILLNPHDTVYESLQYSDEQIHAKGSSSGESKLAELNATDSNVRRFQ